jgi:hypothetical protein
MFVIDHGTRHGWCLLHWLVDAAKIFSIDDSQFHQDLVGQLEQAGRVRQLVLVLGLCKQVFSLNFPHAYDTVYAKWESRLDGLTDYVTQGLTGHRRTGTVISILRNTYGYKVAMSTSVKEQFHVMISLLLISPSDIARFPVPRVLLPIHILLRPFFVLERRIKRRMGAVRS